jgi:hypothetical protein
MALGRKNSLFAGSDGGAHHWALVASLVATAKLNGVEPLAWLTDVLERMVSGRAKAHELERLLPWAWKAGRHGWRVLGPVAERLRALGVPFVVADRPVPNLGATDPRTSTKR